MDTIVEETLKRVSLSRRPGHPARLQWTSPMEASLQEVLALLGTGELREVPRTQQIKESYFLLEVDLDQVPKHLFPLLPERCRSVA